LHAKPKRAILVEVRPVWLFSCNSGRDGLIAGVVQTLFLAFQLRRFVDKTVRASWQQRLDSLREFSRAVVSNSSGDFLYRRIDRIIGGPVDMICDRL
jgi:hypothetical protein